MMEHALCGVVGAGVIIGCVLGSGLLVYLVGKLAVFIHDWLSESQRKLVSRICSWFFGTVVIVGLLCEFIWGSFMAGCAIMDKPQPLATDCVGQANGAGCTMLKASDDFDSQAQRESFCAKRGYYSIGEWQTDRNDAVQWFTCEKRFPASVLRATPSPTPEPTPTPRPLVCASAEVTGPNPTCKPGGASDLLFIFTPKAKATP